MNYCHEDDGLFRRGPGSKPASVPTNPAALPMELLDEIELGLIVCNGEGSLAFCNRAATRELNLAHLLSQGNGFLRQVAGVSGDLQAALRHAAHRSRRSLVLLDRAGQRLMATVLPFGPFQAGGQQVLVMLGRRQPCSELGLEMLASSYRLTLAERRVLSALVRETSPREIAQQHAVSLSTVRTQIQSIRNKLGTKSIEGLLLRAAEVPPVASALRVALAA